MADEPRNTYLVRIHYAETVRGERRRFVHRQSMSATSPAEARNLAVEDFNWLALQSRSGWIREIERVEVRPAGAASPRATVQQTSPDNA